MVCEQTVSNKAKVDNNFCIRGAYKKLKTRLSSESIGSITSRCSGNEPALLPRMTRIPKLYIHRQFQGELCFPPTPTILHAPSSAFDCCFLIDTTVRFLNENV